MVVKEYPNAQAFLTDYETTLLEREAVSQLVLYNAYQKKENNMVEGGLFGAVMQEEKEVLLFCNILPANLVVYVAEQDKALLAANDLANHVASERIIINGITARNDVCQSFMEQYRKHNSCNFVEKLGMDIMEIREVNDIKPAEGIQRLATEEDVKVITDWMIEFQIEALMSELDYEAALQRATELIIENKIYVFENIEKQMVTMAAITKKLVHGVTVTYVYTPEEFRGKGYAATNIYYLSKEQLNQGNEFCTLYVDKKNPLSNRAYEKVGYRILEDSYDYQLIPIGTNQF